MILPPHIEAYLETFPRVVTEQNQESDDMSHGKKEGFFGRLWNYDLGLGFGADGEPADNGDDIIGDDEPKPRRKPKTERAPETPAAPTAPQPNQETARPSPGIENPSQKPNEPGPGAGNAGNPP